jgi:menaquinone-9 beta-reductase
MPRVLIIGAGPGGSALALTLLTRGLDPASITIVESRAFPRVKVCGEFLSPAVSSLLINLVSDAELLRAGAARVDRLVLELGPRERVWPLPDPAWTLSRRTLDDLLLEKVRAAGADVRQPERVADVKYAGDRAVVRLASGETLAVDAVVHADGSGRLDPAGPTPSRRGVVGLKCHFRPRAPIVGVRMRSARGAYIGTVQVESGLATCALVAKSALVARHAGDADALLAELWPDFDPARREGEWLSCGVAGSGYRRPGHPRSLRIGNAAAAVEPVGGEGIGLALWSGSTLGDLLAGAGEWSIDELGRAERTLATKYRRRLVARRPACRAAAAVLVRPALVAALWPALTIPGLSIRPWYALTGKPARGPTPTAVPSRS